MSKNAPSSLHKIQLRRTRLAQRTLGITTRERILAFLQTRNTSGNPIPPSFREIMDVCGISSTSVVAYHLDKLEAQGAIVRGHNVARAMFVPAPQPEMPELGEVLEGVRQELLMYFVKADEMGSHQHWVRRAVAADEIPFLARAVVNHATRQRGER